ncbi:MAG: hypothetical protein WBW53_22780, partial [Terriglobales bacterium]
RFGGGTCILAFATFGVFLCSGLAAQDASQPSLEEQLKAQYKLVKTSADANGLTVVDPGTVLDIQKGGLLGVPPLSLVFCPAKFQDGGLRPPGGLLRGHREADLSISDRRRKSLPHKNRRQSRKRQSVDPSKSRHSTNLKSSSSPPREVCGVPASLKLRT